MYSMDRYPREEYMTQAQRREWLDEIYEAMRDMVPIDAKAVIEEINRRWGLDTDEEKAAAIARGARSA
jgi:hypothetical protein